MGNATETPWWKAEKGKAHAATQDYVRRVEMAQGDIFDRFLKLEALYDPNTPTGDGDSGHVTENVVASNVDTVSAAIATTEVRSRQMTDGADWTSQRRARTLEMYSEELDILLGVHPKCRAAFKECAKKGNGLTKASTVFDKPRIEHVLVENVIVPDQECRTNHEPTQLHQWDSVDVEELCARYPAKREEIKAAAASRRRMRATSWVGELVGNNECEVLFSWRLPTGVKNEKGYRPGRMVVSIEGADLDDRKYEKDHFPLACIVWSERAMSWYGIGGVERIAGIQRALNKRNWQIEKQLDRGAMPTTYVRPADAALATKSNRVGTVAVVKGDYPHTVVPPAVSGETYQSRIDLRSSAFEEFGVSRMAAQSVKPAGIDSGVAMREYRDQTTQRFAPQEQAFEQLVLDTIVLALDQCKDLGTKAPEVTRSTRFGARKLRWADVDMGEVRVQIKAASNLNRSPAGRMQAVIEYAQAGIISQDEARRLLQHPDLQRALSLYTAALENVEHSLDEIADGNIVMPEPFMHLQMCVWRGQMQYLIWRDDGAPEEILESVRQFVVQAAWMLSRKSAANANAAAPAMDATAAPPLPGGEMPALPGGPPMGDPAVAAFAPQAMALRAG